MRPTTLVIPLTDGPDLRLAPLVAEHAEAVFRLVDDDRDRLGARLPWVEGTRSVADTRAFIESSMARRDPAAGGDGGGDWVIENSGAGVVGVLGLHEVRWPHRRTSIGYWIARPHEGRGLVSRSVAIATEHLLAHGLHRIEIRAEVDNARSRAVATRCGFRLEGTHRAVEWLHGRPIDLALYALIANDG